MSSNVVNINFLLHKRNFYQGILIHTGPGYYLCSSLPHREHMTGLEVFAFFS